MECPYLEPGKFGDICHAGIDEECQNPFLCTAIFDIHGNPLLEDEDLTEVVEDV